MPKQRSTLGLLAPAFVLLLVGLGAAGLGAAGKARRNDAIVRERFDAHAQDIADQLVTRFQRYRYGLRGVRGVVVGMLSAGDDAVSRRGFRLYQETRDMDREFPGVRGFGFIRRVPLDQEAAFIEAARRDGAPDFTIHGLAPNDGEKAVIQYIEPVERNLPAVGLDIASEPNRRAAARQAIRDDQPTLTAPLTLVQAAEQIRGAFLMLLPIYRPERSTATPEQRQAATFGWAYAALHIDEILHSFQLHTDEYTLAIYDRADSPAGQAPFFSSAVTARADADGVVTRLPRSFFGRRWLIEVRARPHFLASLNLLSAAQFFAMGAVISVLLFAVFCLFLFNRERTQQARAQSSLESARNELNQILDALPSIIGYWDADLINRFGNRAYHDWFGIEPGMLRGKHIRDFLGPALFESNRPFIEAALRGEPQAFERAIPRTDGQGTRQSLAQYLPDVIGGVVRGFYVMVNDINELSEGRQKLAAAIRENEALLSTIKTHSLYSVTDRKGRIIDVNEGFCQISGYGRDELLGQNHRIINSGTHDRDFWVEMWRTISGGRAWRGEICNRAKDGSLYWVESIIAPFTGADGKIEKFISMRTDVTAKKLATRELAQERERLVTLVRENEALLSTLDRLAAVSIADRHGRLVYVNTAFCETSGYSREELLGQDHRIVNSGVHPPSFWTAMWQTISSGNPWRDEVCNRAKDGSLYWVDSMIAPFSDEDGVISKYISIRTDITVNKVRERELAQERQRLDNILRGTNVGTWEWNVQTGEVRFNERWAAIIGYTLADLSPVNIQTWMAHMDPDELGRFQEAAAKHFAGEHEQFEIECRMRHREGHWIWVLDRGRVSSWDADGTPEWMYGTRQDITVRRETVEALRQAMATAETANAAKSEFLSNMSHEIRTPLNAVIGLSYLLEHTSLDSYQWRLVNKVQLAGRSLLGAINDILDLSKIEAGEMAIEETPFHLSTLLDELEQLLEPQAQAKSLQLVVELAAGVPPVLRGDVTRFRQILINLVSNAIKFTEHGSVHLSVICLEQSAAGVVLRCLVEDTGVGIAHEMLARLFTPFTQADASTTRRFGGTGLGLSIVRRLAELMGGQVGVDSTLGAGSEFWVHLPMQVASDSDAANNDISARSLKIIVAEDDPLERGLLLAMARALGWRTEALSSSSELVERVSERLQNNTPPDALVLAHRMSNIDGLHALSVLAERFGIDRVPPAIVLGAADGTEELRSLPHAHLAEQFLTKPLNSSLLFDTINRAVVRRRGKSRSLVQSLAPDLDNMLLPDVRVLVADDSEINLEVARRILEREGAQVTVVRNGKEALEVLGQSPDHFEIVLMDVQMPLMDGNAATRQIRNSLGLRKLPVVALTAGALLAERQRSLEVGMNAFLTKPLDPRSLVRTVRSLVEEVRGTALPLRPRQGALPQTAAGWPTIAGIDGAEVSIHLGHDVALFAALLGRLQTDYADLAAPPTPALLESAGRRQEMKARLHKLRGTAGMLGGQAVQQLAGQAEASLAAEGDPTEILAVLQTLAEALRSLTNAAQPFLEGHAQSKSASDNDGVGPTNAALLGNATLAEIRDLLLNQDLAVFTRLKTIAPSLQATLGQTSSAELQKAVAAFDFKRAAAVLEESRARV